MYIFQITTKDFGLQLRTEVTADTLDQLLFMAKEMIKNNPKVIGMKYIIAQYKKVGEKMLAETLKTDTIQG